jgi:hypothetical protein
MNFLHSGKILGYPDLELKKSGTGKKAILTR